MRRWWVMVLGALTWGLVSPGGSVADELEQVLAGWNGPPPTALGADASGPFWTRRLDGQTVVLERLSSDGRSMREIRRVTAAAGQPERFYQPQLVEGQGAPELFFRDASRLRAEQDARLSGALGDASWEWYAAGRNSAFLLAVAFGIRETGFSVVALSGGTEPLIVADLRSGGAGVWAPRALLSGAQAFVVYRAGSLFVETMALESLRSKRRWEPSVQEFKPVGSEFGTLHYGSPSACLDETGTLHWASVLWWDQWDVPSGRIVIDGVELEHQGMEDRVDWLPTLACVPNQGLVLAISGVSGNVEVGHVHGAKFSLIAELPSVAPAYGAPPPTRIASQGANFYVATSEGLWKHWSAQKVPVGVSVMEWLLAGVVGFLRLIGVRAQRQRLMENEAV